MTILLFFALGAALVLMFVLFCRGLNEHLRRRSRGLLLFMLGVCLVCLSCRSPAASPNTAIPKAAFDQAEQDRAYYDANPLERPIR